MASEASLKILLLSFYYPPDLSAGSFRAQALVMALLRKLPEQASLDVVTTLPNRYASFSTSAPATEQHGRLSIHRITLPCHQSGMLDQSRAFAVYARAAYRLVRECHYDLVIATSSRLMTATLGACIARRHSAKLYLDIRDIFLESLNDVLPRGIRRLITLGLSPIERWTISSADKVNLVSRGFAGYFEPRYPSKAFSWFTNGIDEPFASLPVVEDAYKSKSRLRVLYAGNIGAGQGLEYVLPQLAERTADRLDFVVLGDGGAKPALKKALTERGVTTVTLRAPVSRETLLAEYQSADILFLHLNRQPAFLRVLPSKLFEYAALGKPIWAGLAGHAAQFVHEEIDNAAVFAPCDIEGAIAALDRLELKSTPREAFVAQYERGTIMSKMAEDILLTPQVEPKATDAV